MDISVYTVPPLGTNCYFISDGTSLGIIDPGGAAEALIEAIEKTGLCPFGIYLTHGHFDHAGAAGAIKERFSIPIYIHTADAPMLRDANTSHASRFGYPFSGCTADKTFEDGDILPMGSISLSVIHTPGHTPGSSLFLHENILFSGDTLFKGSIGNFAPEAAPEMQASLAKVWALPDALTVYPGHNDSTFMATEKRTNPFVNINWEMI